LRSLQTFDYGGNVFRVKGNFPAVVVEDMHGADAVAPSQNYYFQHLFVLPPFPNFFGNGLIFSLYVVVYPALLDDLF